MCSYFGSCVQKLRKQIAIEDALGLTQETEVTLSEPSRRPSGSQYTSRSIVSLSGLSVSDPLPGSYETNAIDHRRRTSSVSSNQGEEDDRIPTTTYRYNPKMVPSTSLFTLTYLSTVP